MRQNRQSTKIYLVHHDTLLDSFRIRIVWFQPKQDSDWILFFKNRIGSDSKKNTIRSSLLCTTGWADGLQKRVSVASWAVFPHNCASHFVALMDFLLLRVAFFWARLMKMHAVFWAVSSKDFFIKEYSFCQFCWGNDVCFYLKKCDRRLFTFVSVLLM